MKNEADVIFMPYNYLLDPKVLNCGCLWCPRAFTPSFISVAEKAGKLGVEFAFRCHVVSTCFQTRKAHNVELQGNVIIFDEAHNLVSFFWQFYRTFVESDVSLHVQEVGILHVTKVVCLLTGEDL